MAVRINVHYNMPTDPAHFERHYLDVHVPLVEKLKAHGLSSFEYGKVLANLDGSEQTLFWIATLTFPSMEAMGGAMATPEGQATGADVPNFASGGVTVLLSEIA